MEEENMNIDGLTLAMRCLLDKDVINRPINRNGIIELVLANNSVIRIKAKPLISIKGEKYVR